MADLGKWDIAKDQCAKSGCVIINDSVGHGESFDKGVIKFKKEKWGRNMWAGISEEFLGDTSIKDIVDRIKNVDSGYVVTNNGDIARNKWD